MSLKNRLNFLLDVYGELVPLACVTKAATMPFDDKETMNYKLKTPDLYTPIEPLWLKTKNNTVHLVDIGSAEFISHMIYCSISATYTPELKYEILRIIAEYLTENLTDTK